jgi:hypothetical protein
VFFYEPYELTLSAGACAACWTPVSTGLTAEIHFVESLEGITANKFNFEVKDGSDP